MSRPSIDEYMMRLAQVAASRTTCIRRGVGCALADAGGRVLSVGYNGVPSSMPHCNEALPGLDAWQQMVKAITCHQARTPVSQYMRSKMLCCSAVIRER